MDGPLHWLKIYYRAPGWLQCDVYLEQAPISLVSLSPVTHHKGQWDCMPGEYNIR